MGVRGAQYAGRVDQRVEPAQLLDGPAHAVDDRILASDVHRQRGEPVAGCGLLRLRLGLGQSFGRDVGGHHGGTFVQQSQRGGLADSRRRAGDQDPFAFESLHSASPLLVASIGVIIIASRGMALAAAWWRTF